MNIPVYFQHAEAGVEYARVHDWDMAAREFQRAIDAFVTEPPPLNDETGMPERFWPAIWNGSRTAVLLLKANGGVLDPALKQYINSMEPTREFCTWTCEACPFNDCVVYVMQGARMVIDDLLGDAAGGVSGFGERAAVLNAWD